jgi:hypothetical protein
VPAGPGQVGCDWTGSGSRARDWCGPGRGRVWRDQDDARGSDMRENQKKRKSGFGYYTHLCWSGRHISRRT